MQVFEDGEWVYKFIKSQKDDNLSQELWSKKLLKSFTGVC
jgi:hypothetical protein